MIEKIKPCPYCPVPTVKMVFNPDGDDAFVECSRCKTQGPSGKNEAEAIAKWNAAYNQLEAKDAEIEQLRKERHTMCVDYERVEAERDDMQDDMLKVQRERDDAKHLLENKQCLIDQLTEHKEIWFKRAFEMLDQRDEARRIAIYLDNLCNNIEKMLKDSPLSKHTRTTPPTNRVDETESDT